MSRANLNQRAQRQRRERARGVDDGAIERFAVTSPVDDREQEMSVVALFERNRRRAQRTAFITDGRRAA